jgi:cytidyltransferase-like protein
MGGVYQGKIVITFGVFDLLHFGHFELFRRCKELAGSDGRFIVAVQEDAIVTKYKPQAKLVYDWNTRTRMIRALRYVDEVVSYGDVDESIKGVDFTTLVVGADQNHAGFQRAMKWCEENGKEVLVLSRTDGISTSIIKGLPGAQ